MEWRGAAWHLCDSEGGRGFHGGGTIPTFAWNIRVERVMPFSIVNQGEGWFWCSLLEVPQDELIGPFPSQIEAEKDARATLGIEEGALTD
jgi:hypothetical protein